MKLTFLGGADEVGASSTLIEIAGKKLLVDVGIRISPKTVRGISGDQLPDLQLITDAGGPDYILVTHAHTDHTGALPLVLEQYPDVPVIATPPTIALTKVLQADAQRIMSNRHEQEGELPLFDEIAVQRLLDAFQTVDMRQSLSLGDGLQVTYHPSGHIMGAAMLLIESEEGILMMSGDLSMTAQRAVVKAQVPRAKADFLVMESTYGGRLHANRAAEEKRLIKTLQAVVERGGKAIIPAFALGRAQEVIQIIHAFRDELDVPVWVDGMVRSVCDAYHIHREYLPKRTQKTIEDGEHLFFRKNVKPIRTKAQREQVAHADGPAVIVSSSGMLTGGPSVAYAKWLAEDERNAIYLTGYQDEESPGRAIQKMLSDHSQGKTVSFKVDDTVLQLVCELGTYSLSAHADHQELLNIAEDVGAEHVALVHGDVTERHKVAAGLRDRNKRAHLPKSGTAIEMTFAKRAWAVGVKKGAETAPLDPEKLWESLKTEAGSYFSARELAQAWWGESGRYAEVIPILSTDAIYFAQSWRRKDTFQVRTPENVARSLNQRSIIQRYPDLMGKVIVLRDVNNRARIGVVRESKIDGFRVTAAKSKGQHYPADALVYPVADWETFPGKLEEKGFMAQLVDIQRQAEALRDVLLPFDKRRALELAGKPVDPATLVPTNLPENVSPQLAQLSIVLTLAKDGAVLTDGGLKLGEASQSEPMEMNEARKTVMSIFDDEARLRKVSMDANTNQMTLAFDFPSVAEDSYAEQIEYAATLTNWRVTVAPDVNQHALGMAVHEVLPPTATVRKGPSFFLAQGYVKIEAEGVEDPEAITEQYAALTGFSLYINENAEAADMTPLTATASSPVSEQMEINAAYGTIREALSAYGLYKTSLKQGRIVLMFISPQVGLRHYDQIEALSQQVGYEITIHPHPNQNAILQYAQKLLSGAGIRVTKGPSIYIDRGEVGARVSQEIPDEQYAALKADFVNSTGFELNIEVREN